MARRARSSPSCGAGRRGSRRKGRDLPSTSAAQRRALRSASRQILAAAAPRRCRPWHRRSAAGRRWRSPGAGPGCRSSSPRGRGRSRLRRRRRWNALGRAADDLGGEDDVLRDPAGDVDRRIALVAQRLHQLRDRRAARAAAGWRAACPRRSPRRAAPSGAGRPGPAVRTCPATPVTPTIQRKNSIRCGSVSGTSTRHGLNLGLRLTRGRRSRRRRSLPPRSAVEPSAPAPSRGQRRGAFGSVDAARRRTVLRPNGFHQRPNAMGQAQNLRQAEYRQRRRGRQIRASGPSRSRAALPARAGR